MPCLDRNQQTTCNYCGKMVKKVILLQHKKSCASGTKSCAQFPNAFCKTQTEMDHHTATKHAIPSMIAETKCNNREEEYPSFYSLQRHKKSIHGTTSRIQNMNVNRWRIYGRLRRATPSSGSPSLSTFFGWFRICQRWTACFHFCLNYCYTKVLERENSTSFRKFALCS